MMTNKEYRYWMKEKKKELLNKGKPERVNLFCDEIYPQQDTNRESYIGDMINENMDNHNLPDKHGKRYFHRNDYLELNEDIKRYIYLLVPVITQYGLDKEAENIMQEILYCITKLEYINLNDKEGIKNFPAIDLMSPNGDIAYQVTTQKDNEEEKLVHTKDLTLDYKNYDIKRFEKRLVKKYTKYFTKLKQVKVIFFTLEVSNPKMDLKEIQGVEFTSFGIPDLCEMISDADTEFKYPQLKAYLEYYLKCKYEHLIEITNKMTRDDKEAILDGNYNDINRRPFNIFKK